jgi:hypothetical protein
MIHYHRSMQAALGVASPADMSEAAE